MRRKNDFYPTPEWATEELLRYVGIAHGGIRGTVFEPCAGDLAIAKVIDKVADCFCSDIDRSRDGCTMYGDAREIGFWVDASDELGGIDWVITNPPFNVAPQIVPLAHYSANVGIAMLLRLSYLEPVENRGVWLNEHPPTNLIVLPRISFTGDGKTDNVTCAWMVWEKSKQGTITIAENPKFPRLTEREAQLVLGAIPLQALL